MSIFKQINNEDLLIHSLVLSGKRKAPFVQNDGEERSQLTQVRVCIIFMQETAANYTVQ